jgi:uroporphyrinogen decarboxylase
MSRFIDALKQNNHDRPPIWIMRQAGRYLPQYRELKKNRPLLELFRTPEMIVDITLLPIDILDVDAAILFSDILTVLEGLGQGYHFEEGRGPVIHTPITTASQLHTCTDCYQHIEEAITILKQRLDRPLIGFAGAPFTVASYLIEEARSPQLKKTKELYFREPKEFEKILDHITKATIAYLEVQIKAGVDAIQLFDSWAGALSVYDFRICSLQPLAKIAKALEKYSIPIIVFCRGSSLFAQELATLPISCISIDFSADMGEIRRFVPNKALQGNLDPMLLYGSYQKIQEGCDRILNAMEGDPGFIFNLGHGVLPDSDLNKVKYMVDYVKTRAPCTAS